MRAVVLIFDTKAEQQEFMSNYANTIGAHEIHRSVALAAVQQSTDRLAKDVEAARRKEATKNRAKRKAKQKAKAKAGRKTKFQPDTSLYGQTVKVYRMALDSDRNPTFLREGPLERIDDPITYVVGGNLYTLNETTDFSRNDDGSLELFVIEEN